ncbi:MAG: T9SS type A sorting domain-containing protein, partial [Bacteroidota bacterium]
NYSGTSALPNINGIVITAPNNTIGSSILGERNVISGNQHTGIRMDRPTACHNLIIGNFIGTDYTGTDSIGNYTGIWITHLDTLLSPSNNIIGGSTLNERNIISGNRDGGITIDGIGADSNIVMGNYIGVDKTGLTALSNGGNGIGVWNGPKNNLIGGDTPEHRNIISGNLAAGIAIHNLGTDSNAVIGNYIGVDINGTSAIPNKTHGINCTDGAKHNRIGGPNIGERNIISGNLDCGIVLYTNADFNTVMNNYIGTDISGSISLPNTVMGVNIADASSLNIIANNLISGNGLAGIGIWDSSNNNEILGNYIGTDLSGTLSLGNTGEGIIIDDSPNNIIGGTNSGERNIVSANGQLNIGIRNSNSTGNLVLGNYIGINISGTSALNNGNSGIGIYNGANNNIIGGNSSSARNIISGNLYNGVWLNGNGTDSNTVSGNYIGTSVSGYDSIPNGGNGISIIDGASNNIIGGDGIDSANTIAFNNANGVIIANSGSNFNRVSHNSIFSNVNLGIDLQSSANNNISKPVISSISNSIVTGTASPNASVEIFTDTEEEGKIFIDTAKADVSGNFFKQLDLSSIPDNFNITATQTSNNNTSEFSTPIGIPPSAPQNLAATGGNLQVALHWNPNTESDLHKYNIYRGTTSPAVTLIDSVIVSSSADTNYIDNNITPDTTYYYRITAVDSSGNESQFSTEVSAVPQGTAPQINITQSSLEFGSITVGSSKDVIIQINNSGDDLLQISNIATDNVVFTPLVASIQIDGGEEENFTIRFTPTAEQEYSANLSYSSNASNYVAVSLSGKGFVYNSIINSLQHTYSFGTADVKDQTNYRLVGFPGVLTLNLADVILDKQNGIDWQAYYDPGSNEYVKYSTSDNRFNLTPGIGYWLICNASINLTKSSVPAVSLNSENSYNIPLHNGWNIISNPFVVNVDWDAVKTKNGTGQSIYYYTNGGYISPPPTLFEPYKGYYFNNSNPQLSGLKIPYPASLSKSFLSEMQLKKTNVDSVITLSAKNNGNEIGELEIGFSDDSSDKLDLRDIFAPPLGFTKYYFSLQNDSLETEYKYLAKEFRASLGEGQVYNVLLRSEINSQINIHITGMHNFDGYEVYLLEKRTKNLQLIKEELEFQVIHNENELQLIIGKSAFIEKIKEEIIPRDYVLYQNYPNPFNPVTYIRFSIPEEEKVTIEIYDLLGQRIAVLSENEIFTVGYHEVLFDASGLSSGVYLYRIKAGEFFDIKKMVLIK